MLSVTKKSLETVVKLLYLTEELLLSTQMVAASQTGDGRFTT